MKFNKTIVFNFLLILFSIGICAQELPPIKNYSPTIYNGENQNWSISQSKEKYIYVANNSGLLEFDGAKWRIYASPNNTVMRSVNAHENKIYTGCYMEFGYWKRNEFGNLYYTSISSKIKESLIEEDFWNILNFDNWVLFQSLNRIYIYNTIDESIKIINYDTQLPKAFKVGDGIYFQKMEEGVFKIENGKPVLVSDHPLLRNSILVNIFKSDDKILYQTQNDGFYYLTNKELIKWNIAANSIISAISVYSSLQLSDGSFVLGTISDGMYHLDKNGNLLLHVNQEKGLNNNTILAIFEDVENNLWLGLDNGISFINFNSPFKIYNDFRGKLGAVYASAIFNNKLYLGTNQGLFYKNLGTNIDFTFINGTEGQVWCLKVYDNTLFCGHNKGTFVLNDSGIKLLSDMMGTMEIKPVKKNKNLLIQGCYSGFNVIEKKNGSWQFRNKIKGFNPTSRYFEFAKDGSILMNHEYKGVFKIELNSDYTEVLNYRIFKNVQKALRSGIASYQGDVLYGSNLGIFKFNDEFKNFEKNTLLDNYLVKDDSYVSGRLINIESTKTLWGFTEKGMFYFSPGKLNNVSNISKIPLEATSRKFIAGFENVLHLKDESYLFGASEGYIIVDLKKIKPLDFAVHINSIDKGTINIGSIPVALNSEAAFKNKENNVSFKFSAPEYYKYAEINYQYQLKGMYDEWSAWSKESEVIFKNLPYGDYTFNVKARIGGKISNNVATFSFRIKRPWYLSNEIIVVYVLLFFVLWSLIHTLYKRYYTKQKKSLMDKKQREFSLTQLENEKEIMKLRNEKLQSEIESKTRELSASTMSIIKKNELLNTIKNELGDVKDDQNVKPVIKIINKNLSNTSDWEMFQEAFNNADSDFLKKVKVAHPNLTPNDLRLCAYLRLNLSSKEIAPLLNISDRSVEIKRYRLRKKMDLAHEKSLVEYILEL